MAVKVAPKKEFIDKRPDADNSQCPDFPKVFNFRRLWSKNNSKFYYGIEPNGKWTCWCEDGIPESSTVDPEWTAWKNAQTGSQSAQPLPPPPPAAITNKFPSSTKQFVDSETKRQKVNDQQITSADISNITSMLSMLNNNMSLFVSHNNTATGHLAQIAESSRDLAKYSAALLNETAKHTKALNELTNAIKSKKTEELISRLMMDTEANNRIEHDLAEIEEDETLVSQKRQ